MIGIGVPDYTDVSALLPLPFLRELKTIRDMLPVLPRQMLWRDRQTMDEFFKLDSINEDFFEVFSTLREEPFSVQMDEVKVFNEVYYQITRMFFEYPMPSDLPKYIADIKANLGWNYSARLVFTMAYFLMSLIPKPQRPLNKFFTKTINEKLFGCIYWKPFKHCFEKLKKEKKHVQYMFRACPYPPDYFKDKYIRWNEITHGYDLMCIERVINLWNNMHDKRDVAVMINDSISYYSYKRNSADIAHLRHFMEVYMISSEDAPIWRCAEDSPWEECDKLKARIDELDKEKMAFIRRINELESENERVNALLEKKKRNGTARKFTLVQIVEYCKRCVDWDDAKSIVAMLNKLLRRVGTEEDSDLVDSIETEFLNRRYGPTFNNAQVTMPNAQIDTVNRITGNDTVYLGEDQDGEES